MTPQPATHMVSMHVHAALQYMVGQSMAAGHGMREINENLFFKYLGAKPHV